MRLDLVFDGALGPEQGEIVEIDAALADFAAGAAAQRRAVLPAPGLIQEPVAILLCLFSRHGRVLHGQAGERGLAPRSSLTEPGEPHICTTVSPGRFSLLLLLIGGAHGRSPSLVSDRSGSLKCERCLCLIRTRAALWFARGVVRFAFPRRRPRVVKCLPLGGV